MVFLDGENSLKSVPGFGEPDALDILGCFVVPDRFKLYLHQICKPSGWQLPLRQHPIREQEMTCH